MVILPSITTTSRRYGWQAKVEETRRLRLTEIALFPTGIGPAARQNLYKELLDSPVESIPFVHLRSDMTPEEVSFLVERFGTRKFNIHPDKDYPLEHDLSAYDACIYVENRFVQDIEDADLQGRGGICLDVSHHEDCRRQLPEMYAHVTERLQHYPCGCWHVSAVRTEAYEHRGQRIYSDHTFRNLNEFDYATSYRDYLPDVVALELENPLEQQIAAADYLKSRLTV